MKKLLLFYLFLLVYKINPAQSTFAVWQGFSHSWTYNHRLNRLGDFIAQSSTAKYCDAVHTGATGLGKDSASFISRYGIVHADNLSYFAGKAGFSLKGEEGTTCRVKKIIQLHPEEELEQKEVFISLLNGFDIISTTSADKLQFLQFSITDPAYDSSAHLLTFSIEVLLNTDCRSLECNFMNDQFDYTMEIHYLILGGKQDELAVRETNYKEKISWDTKSEIHPAPFTNAITIQPGFQNTFLAYKSISITLDKEHHYLSMGNAIKDVSINIENHTAAYSMDLFFKNWSANMKESKASGGQAFFSNKRAGWCVWEGTLNVVQFKSGSVTYHERSGGLFWEGKNKSPGSDAAKNIKAIVLQ